MIRKLTYILLSFILIAGCRSGGDNLDRDFDEVPDSLLSEGELKVSEQAMEDIVQNISSPVEIAALVKSLGVPFSKKYLATTENVNQLNTSFEQSLHLGIYGADLGYLNMYSKTSSVLEYITSIKTLSDAINVGQFFDFVTLKRLATNSQNLDSLMYISVHSFNMMDRYLRENNRGNLSALIVAGVWIEGLYLATQVSKESSHPDLAERIGEQKIIIGDLLLILKNYKRDPQIESLISDLEEIKAEFNDVKITYEMGEPEAVEKDGMLMIIQNETSIVHITDEQLARIIQKTEEIRNKIIKAKV